MKNILLVLSVILCIFESRASSDTLLFNPNDVHQSANHWQKLEDKDHALTIHKVIHSDNFLAIEKSVANLGVSNSVFWLKARIKNNTGITDPVIEIPYPIIDKIAIYKVRNDSILFVDSAGESYPFSIRNNNNQAYVFKLHLAENECADYYIKLSSGEQIIVPINLASYNVIQDDQLSKDLISGIYFGIIIVMLLYNLFVYVSVRDNSYLYYVAYIFSVGLTQAALNGYGFKYLWPEIPWLAERSTYLTGCLSGITTAYFARNFLHTKEFSPKFNKLLSVYIWLYVLSFVLAITGYYNISYNLINLNAGPGSLILIYNSYLIYRERNYQPAKFFFIAFTIFVLSIVVFVLKDFGVIPYNALTINGLQIGSAIEVTLLSFALADRINIFKREKEESQAEALKIAKENERIIREQNIMLETKVTERTAELNESNLELNNTLDELKSAQSQLVESEKMASLGQLTAGIAHEINNPINFVSSNVKPLKRDIDMIIDMVEKIEQISISNFSIEEKQKQINELKSENDYDYLKTEIDFLMKGINEGSTRTAEIVKGLRVFSRLDEDDLKKADINEGIESTLIIVNNLISKIEIRKNYGNLPHVECYPGKLNQVFLNIITNALHAITSKFKDEKGGFLIISTRVEKDRLLISFADNGSGMTEATKQKLFEPFFTTKAVGEGTGLGLSIVYNTIKKHNGSIKVNSVLGEGTEFIIDIPLVQQLS